MAIYQILEVANSHGGNKDYLKSLISEFEGFTGYGMKFQPFKYDLIASPDFEWYPVYEKLFFNESEWDEIIDMASASKDVWLDLFDDFGLTILKRNLKRVFGIKLQASVINNVKLLEALSSLDLSNIHLVVNISGFSITDINGKLAEIENLLSPKEVLIEVGFQDYPTSVADSGLSKIKVLKENFRNRIVFADHVDGKSDDAILLPILAVILGADLIEKHIKHSTFETKYDHFSSIDKDAFSVLSKKLALYESVLSEPFVNTREQHYLFKTLQIPIVNRDVSPGETISMKRDLDYKRTGMAGLNVAELKRYLSSCYVTAQEIEKGQSIVKSSLKKATIATIIACRLKSSRLEKKALLKIGKLSSVELCIKNSLKFKNINHTILATSVLGDDAELKTQTYRKDVIFHTGDPEDVIKRYLDACEKLKVDIIVRVTGDMPYISDEIFDLLLASHFENGADFTYSINSAVGTSPEIINTSALRRVQKHFPNADYSEYMSWYLRNNPEHFKLNAVELPPELSRNYRLTIDYKEDLTVFNAIEENFEGREFGLREIFDFLDNNPEIADINNHLDLKYVTDQELITRLNKFTKIM
jgi:spore coat polysaccharide biosynthesis protein SpsF (cytidylyltransferase family)/sialic acid synthase SpsE